MNETIWQRLLFAARDTEAMTQALKSALEAEGYIAYNPFPGGSGSPIGKLERQRMFVAPPADGWRRVLVSPEDLLKPAFLASLQLPGPLLDIQLGPEEHRITVYSPDGDSSTDLAALEPFLRSDTSHEALEVAASAILAKGTKPNASASSLPAEIEQMAAEKGVNVGQVDKLMGRMSRRLFRKMSKESDGEADAMKDQARSIMMSQGNINWNSPVAQRLQLIMQHLSVPENWHLPDWKAIVGAYPLALQQQRGGDLLLPGDRETLQRVPDAAEFMPIYYARRITE